MIRDQKPLPVAPRKENICAVVVTYFPDEGFCDRSKSIRDQVDHIVMVDNGSDAICLDRIQTVLSGRDVDRIRNPTNLGVATALNQGAQWARENGYSWVLLLDQDTVPSDDMVSTLIRAYDQFPEKDRLAIVGCSHFAGSGIDISSPKKAGWWTSTKVVITSGTLLSLRAAAQIGLFREEFFIDCVDFEFCLRAGCAGYSIVEVLEPLMQHVIGNPQRVPLQWIARETSNHRPWRSYYITRNLAVLTREYLWKEPAWILAAIYRRIKGMILMILFEQAKLQKVKYITLGLYDGLTGRFDRSVI
jgi:rhamnosyltransferase